MIFLFLTSGLFLGWSLGANDAANIFGTAVGSRMLKFYTAAIIATVFVVIGAVVQGTGASETLNELGKVDALAGSFTVTLSAALTVFAMTKYALPVSTSQAVVGGIIGWNFFTGNPTDTHVLINISITWVMSPVLGALFAIILYKLVKFLTLRLKIHLLRLDAWIRYGLILAGAFGAYSLGANNIANVMGVYVGAVPLNDIHLFGSLYLTGAQQLFLLGALAIGAGIITFSKRTMKTVGNNLMRLSAEAAIVIVLAHSLVLFVFSSTALQQFLVGLGLPEIPLVPVSSSHAVIGAIIGIGLLKGGRGIRYRILGYVALGWIATPVIAAMITYFLLFFVNNVFGQAVSQF
jgi:PiT family inorganic phosphate transporter